jgi:DNA-binding NtrC family response regulator
MKMIKNIIIIDDSIEMQSIYKQLFKNKSEYNIVYEKDAREAFRRVKRGNFDLIILDLLMEPMSGEDFFANIMIEKEYEKIPVLIISVLSEETVEYMKKEGNIYFLQKPISREVFFETIEKIDGKGSDQ